MNSRDEWSTPLPESLIATTHFSLVSKPIALELRLGERLLLRSATAGVFCRNGRQYVVTAVTAHEQDGARQVYHCATDDPAFTVILTVTTQGDRITVRWEAADSLPCERIGDAYEVASAGHWYGHGYHEPQYWPLEAGGIKHDPFLCNNVQAPIWLTSGGAGIVVTDDELLAVSLNDQGDGLFRLEAKDVAAFEYHLLAGDNILDVFGKLLDVIGKPQRVPPADVFANPIYSTWTQHPRYITQQKVMEFARQIVDAGLPTGILEIDEKYQTSFGEINFDPAIFPDPAGMLRELRALGFSATLWTSPFINTDSPAFTELRDLGALVKDARTGEPGTFAWWAGEAALLDVTHPAGDAWYAEKLQAMADLGFVGFKFDGGDGKYAPPFAHSAFHVPQRPQGYSNRYLEFIAKHFPAYSESRVAWMVQREGLLTREGGKDTHWGLDNGLHALVTQGLTQSVLGYPYLICDMIPGRVQTRFADAPLPTDELFVRWVEASALTPVMQFSYGPWNYSDATCAVVRHYAWLHKELGDYLYAMAQQCPQTGMPMVRPLFFDDPADAATYTVDDEFLLGDDLLVAPVLNEGAVTRDIYLPAGEWCDAWSGERYTGGQTLIAHPAPCPGIPLFIRQGGAWSERLAAICAGRLGQLTRGSIASGVTTATYSATLSRTI